MSATNKFWNDLKTALRSSGVFMRNKIPLPLKLLAVFRYFLGSSYRIIARNLHINVSHVSVWNWYHALGKALMERIFKLAGGAKVVIVDETVINFRGKEVYLWAAIDPETRKIVFLYPSYSRSYLAALKFFTLMMRFAGKPELVITDGGPWYKPALRRLGIKHKEMHGGERNYIERWFETLKDRARGFDVYYPGRRDSFETLLEWLSMFVLYYNHARYHMTLGRPLVPLRGSDEYERWIFAVHAALILS